MEVAAGAERGGRRYAFTLLQFLFIIHGRPNPFKKADAKWGLAWDTVACLILICAQLALNAAHQSHGKTWKLGFSKNPLVPNASTGRKG
jgi:hypothetical protein